jgi:elongator complex protein 6
MASRIPPLLEPYLSLPPEASLILLTSVLGASTNWLVLRYLQSALVPSAVTGADTGRSPGLEVGGWIGGVGNADTTGNGSGDTKGDGTAVVLVSFLRDLSFWREGGRKLVSL